MIEIEINDVSAIIAHLEILTCYQDKRVNDISLIPLLNKLRNLKDYEDYND